MYQAKKQKKNFDLQVPNTEQILKKEEEDTKAIMLVLKQILEQKREIN